MNKITTIAFAGALGILGLACGFAAPASAQVDSGMSVAYGTGVYMPTDQHGSDGRAGFVAGAYGDVLGRDTKGGDTNGLIGLLNQENTGRDTGGSTGELVPAVRAGELVPAVMPTDQKGADVNKMYGDLLGRDTGGSTGELVPAVRAGELVPAVMPEYQTGGNQTGGRLASLQGLGTVGDLFLNSRPGEGAAGGANMQGTGGDAGNGLLLPAVRVMGDGSVKPIGSVQGGTLNVGTTHVTPSTLGLVGHK